MIMGMMEVEMVMKTMLKIITVKTKKQDGTMVL